jgi:hypothetical protein
MWMAPRSLSFHRISFTTLGGVFMRFVHLIFLPALLAGASAYSFGDANAQGTPEQQQACASDAMRLCADAMPDIAKITACMTAKHAQLSPACKTAMVGPASAPHQSSARQAVVRRLPSPAPVHSSSARPAPQR